MHHALLLAREHGASENFTRWNQRGEAQLAIDAKERRTHFVLEQPRNLKYFDDVYELAESTYNTSLNWATTPKNVSFINFQYTVEQQDKIYRLFFDHDINFDKFDQVIEYYFVKIQLIEFLQNNIL